MGHRRSANHSQHVKVIIDGKLHPELIPDLQAYRMFFLAATPDNGDAKELAKQNAHISKVDVDASDTLALTSALNDFRQEYDSMVKEYNGSSVEHHADDYAAFNQRVDQLVQFTLDKLKAAMSAHAFAKFQAHVQKEKAGMQIITAE
jgi:uncharacterized protein YukE